MRVIGRVLLGTLAIVFAMVFVARIVQRRSVHGRKHVRTVRLLGELTGDPHSQASESQPAQALPEVRADTYADTYLAAQPGGSGWGHLVVPPSSPSHALRRNGRRGTRSLAGYSGRGRRRAALGPRALRCKKRWAP